MSSAGELLILEVYLAGSKAVVTRDYEAAVNTFSSVADHLDQFECAQNIDSIVKILSNRGLCHTKLRNDSAAIEDFSNLLDRIEIYRFLFQNIDQELAQSVIIESWVNLELKTLMRRAVCYENIGEYRKAKIDLDTIKLNHSDYFSRTLSLQSQWIRLGHTLEQDRVAAKIDGRPAWMAHAHQSLRLSLIRALPRQLRLKQPFTCRVALGNELGLFDRSMFSKLHEDQSESNLARSLGTIRCEVFALDRTLSQNLPPLITLLQDQNVQSNCVQIGDDGKAVLHLMFAENNSPIENSEITSIDVLLRFNVEHCMGDSLKSSLDILPVISIPITLHLTSQVAPFETAVSEDATATATETTFKALKKNMSNIQINCLRPIKLPQFLQTSSSSLSNIVDTHGTEVLCGESVGLLGIGGKIWDSTFILIQYLYLHQNTYVRDQCVLELGAGTGITSLALTHLSPTSILSTDLPEVVPLITVNMQLNTARSDVLRDVLTERYRVAALTWGESIPEDIQRFNVIIASDVIYYPEGYAPLLQTLEELLAYAPSQSTIEKEKCCILAHRHRHPEDHKFFAMLAASSVLQTTEIFWQKELSATLLPSVSANSAEDAGSNQPVTLQDVRLFYIFQNKRDDRQIKTV